MAQSARKLSAKKIPLQSPLQANHARSCSCLLSPSAPTAVISRKGFDFQKHAWPYIVHAILCTVASPYLFDKVRASGQTIANPCEIVIVTSASNCFRPFMLACRIPVAMPILVTHAYAS